VTNPLELKQRANAAIDERRDEWIRISSTLHANPEIAFQEHKSAALLCDALEAHGLAVTRGYGGLETAFCAEAKGAGDGPTIALLAEYDALPKLGHACGHNIIATSSIAAGVALHKVIGELAGRVLVLGTPAEEGGGGKLILLENSAFDGIDAAMMVHPAAWTMTTRTSLASSRLTLEFTGLASHAAAAPEDGINALEAVILTFNGVNALRLHLKPDARVHGIITRRRRGEYHPGYAAAQFVCARPAGICDEVLQRVIQCAEAASIATGAQLKYTVKPGYKNMIPNQVMARLFAENWRAIGVEVHDPRPNERMGSTDMGNVSQVVPSLHPYLAIAPDGTAGHSVEFREASISPNGHEGLLKAAKGMAMTTIDLLSAPQLMRAVKQEFAATVGN
jgi:amidohydrolase